jgi:hypothetical protein
VQQDGYQFVPEYGKDAYGLLFFTQIAELAGGWRRWLFV